MSTSEEANINSEAFLFFSRSAARHRGLVSSLSLMQCPRRPHVSFLARGASPSFPLLSLSSPYTDRLGSDSALGCRVTLLYLLPNKELSNYPNAPTF